jgi:hypothetical protein
VIRGRLGRWWWTMESQFVLPVASEQVSHKASAPVTAFLLLTKLLIRRIYRDLLLPVIVLIYKPINAVKKENYMFLVINSSRPINYRFEDLH